MKRHSILCTHTHIDCTVNFSRRRMFIQHNAVVAIVHIVSTQSPNITQHLMKAPRHCELARHLLKLISLLITEKTKKKNREKNRFAIEQIVIISYRNMNAYIHPLHLICDSRPSRFRELMMMIKHHFQRERRNMSDTIQPKMTSSSERISQKAWSSHSVLI